MVEGALALASGTDLELPKGILRWRVLAGIIAKWGAATIADNNILWTIPGGVILPRFLVCVSYC